MSTIPLPTTSGLRKHVAPILFLHGLESGPLGTKARWLAARFGAVTPQLDTRTFAAALDGARAALDEVQPKVVVASSFGGAIAVRLLHDGTWSGPTVLIAPAQARLGEDVALPFGSRVVVFHGEADDVIPVSDSRRLVAGAGPGVTLHVLPGGDHRLNQILEDGTLARALAAFGLVPVVA